MIIAISGKIGSGKDTVGNIIQTLIVCSKTPLHENLAEDVLRDIKLNVDNARLSNFTNKKFADTLKHFICLLIGCTREQLEDPQFKNKELGPEWWYYKVKNVGEGYRLVNYLNNNESETWLKIANPRYLIKHTPRTLLTSIGTDAIKTIVHPNAWINALFANYQQIVGYAPGNYYCKCGKCGEQFTGDKRAVRCEKCSVFYPNWIITDLRFPDEFDAVKQREGITIRVNRPYTTTGGNGIPATFDKSQFHISETALDNHKFDYTIENDGSMEDLIEKVKQVLIQEKII